MKSVRLRDLRRSPRHRVLNVNDNLTRMIREAEKHQQAMPNERAEIGHDPIVGTYILYSSTRRRRY